MRFQPTSHRRFLPKLTLLLTIALLVSACSGGAAQTPAGSTTPQATAAVTTEESPIEEVAGEEATDSALTITDTAATESAPAGETSDETREVVHDFGTTIVPANPQRIVAINSAAIELVAALGIKPVGIAAWTGAGNQARIPAHIAAVFDLEGVEFLGDAYQPNLEAIAAVHPDLILMNGGSYYQDLYDQVSKIAPTVAYASWPDDSDKATWKEFFTNMTKALGKEAEAQTVIDAWQARIAEFDAATDVDGIELSVVRLMPETIMAYKKGSYSGTVLEDVGVKQVPAQEEVVFAQDYSMEEIPSLDGDAILLVQSDPNATLYKQLVASPLWQQLSAVKAGQVYLIDSDLWIGGDGYVSANAILDDLEKLFLDDGAGLEKAE